MEDDASAPFASQIIIEVAFALPARQKIVTLTVPAGTTASQAVALAELERYFPELPAETFTQARLGIFGRVLRDPTAHVLHEQDRVEVYRPLLVNPMDARAQRARTIR